MELNRHRCSRRSHCHGKARGSGARWHRLRNRSSCHRAKQHWQLAPRRCNSDKHKGQREPSSTDNSFLYRCIEYKVPQKGPISRRIEENIDNDSHPHSSCNPIHMVKIRAINSEANKLSDSNHGQIKSKPKKPLTTIINSNQRLNRQRMEPLAG